MASMNPYRKKKSIWKSKKGGIPAINELVIIVMNVLPKPILLALFILLVTLIGTFLMPAILSMFGYSCLEEGGSVELYQVPMSSLAEKYVSDSRKNVRSFFGLEDYKLPEDPFPSGDRRYLQIPEQCIVDQNINGSIITGYTSICTNCSVQNNWFSATFFWQDKDVVCLGDGFYEASPSGALVSRNFCYQCAPPVPYYFNITNCESADECYFTITDTSLLGEVQDVYNYYLDRIKQLGGVKRTQDSTELINIQCEEVDEPQLYFFNIKIFDQALWIILIIGGFFISFAYMYYSNVI